MSGRAGTARDTATRPARRGRVVGAGPSTLRWVSTYRLLVVLTAATGFAALVMATRFSDDRRLLLLGQVIAMLVIVSSRDRTLINALFRLVQRAPLTWPLTVRVRLARSLHIGGVHSGASLALVVWAIVAAAAGSPAAAVTGAVLVVIATTSVPVIRHRWHNLFDHVHVIGVPLIVILLWVQVMASPLRVDPISIAIVTILVLVTVATVVPWLRVRRVEFVADKPSDHVAILRTESTLRRPPPGTASSYSRGLFGERHSFVNVPSREGTGWRLVVSRAGDWTGAFIDDLPEHLVRRGVPVLETGSMDRLFHSVVLLVTGSGIGPGLSHLGHSSTPTHLVWVSRDPAGTFGEPLLSEIEELSSGALVWDTSKDGKPDVTQLALREMARSGAEALFVISNRTLSTRLVNAFTQRGIPAFGPTWDT